MKKPSAIIGLILCTLLLSGCNFNPPKVIEVTHEEKVQAIDLLVDGGYLKRTDSPKCVRTDSGASIVGCCKFIFNGEKNGSGTMRITGSKLDCDACPDATFSCPFTADEMFMFIIQ